MLFKLLAFTFSVMFGDARSAALSGLQDDGGDKESTVGINSARWSDAIVALPDEIDPKDDDPAMDGDVADQGWGDALDRLGSDVASTESEGCDATALSPEEHLLGSVHVPDQDEVLSLRTLEDVLTLARVSHLVSDEYLHPEYVRCAEHFLRGKMHHVSTAAEAEALGMSRASVRRLRILAASLAHNLERFGWAAVERCVLCHEQYTSWKVRVPDLVFSREMTKNDTDMYMNTDMYIYTYRYIYMCGYVCVFVFLLCGAVSCRESRVVVGWVVFVLVSWSLSLRRYREIERRRKSKREMARRSLNK